jgi:hypothetical protein
LSAGTFFVKLLAEIGAACEKYQQETLRNLACKRAQCDEIWSFCNAKQLNFLLPVTLLLWLFLSHLND